MYGVFQWLRALVDGSGGRCDVFWVPVQDELLLIGVKRVLLCPELNYST